MSRRIVILLIALAVTLGACTPAPKVTTLTGADKDAVLVYSESMTAGLLAGLNAGDYAQFSKDFNDAMKQGIPESNFANMRQQITGKLGAYVSREVKLVEQVNDNIRITYSAKFEQEDGVTMQVIYTGGEPHKVTGLFFTSPKLRGQ